MSDRDLFDRWLDSLPWWQAALVIIWTLAPLFVIAGLLTRWIVGGKGD